MSENYKLLSLIIKENKLNEDEVIDLFVKWYGEKLLTDDFIEYARNAFITIYQ